MANPTRATCAEAEKTSRETDKDAAHDAYNPLLYRQPPNTEALWDVASRMIEKDPGVLVLDDSTLDKPYVRHTELVTHHRSRKHHAIVGSINLQTLLWTDGATLVLCDFRVYGASADGLSKNDTFRLMLHEAKRRELNPTFVLFESWYSGLDNLKAIRDLGWEWLTWLKSSRQVNPDGTGNRPIEEIEISAQTHQVHLRGYGFIKVFRAKRGIEAEH